MKYNHLSIVKYLHFSICLSSLWFLYSILNSMRSWQLIISVSSLMLNACLCSLCFKRKLLTNITIVARALSCILNQTIWSLLRVMLLPYKLYRFSRFLNVYCAISQYVITCVTISLILQWGHAFESAIPHLFNRFLVG